MTDLRGFRGVIRVERGGDVLTEIAGGMADEASNLACAPDVRFQLASVSKQFAAAAVLLLSDEQRLSVGDPVAHWIDGCPPSWQDMTLRHLLTHTSGLPHWHDIPEITLAAPMDAEQELSAIQHATLVSPPGERWIYSSPGYWLLANVVQRASNRPYAAFVSERLFEPLGLTTMFAGNANSHRLVAADHMRGVPVPTLELSAVGMGAGDLWSTAEDVLKWDKALMRGRLLSEQSLDMMFAPQVAVHDPTGTAALSVTGYGFGWFVGSASGHRALLHPGDNAGCVSLNLVLPDDDIRLVILSNEGTTRADQIAVQLLESLLSTMR
jgi:CubicO group peptidase (beta-lactamase class C family)